MTSGEYVYTITTNADPVALRHAIDKARSAGLAVTDPRPKPRPWWHLTPFWSGYFTCLAVFLAATIADRWL